MNLTRRMMLAAATALALVPAAGMAQETIKVGEINHYKRMAAFAEPYKMGIELALKEINADGGVLVDVDTPEALSAVRGESV